MTAHEVREADMFSVQINTTQDVSSTDQCAIILRYVTDAIQEWLLDTFVSWANEKLKDADSEQHYFNFKLIVLFIFIFFLTI